MNKLAMGFVLAAGTAFAYPGRQMSVKPGTELDPVLAFAASASDGDLYLAYGRTDGGDTTNGWEHVDFVGAVPTSACELRCPLPAGCGTAYTCYRFFLLYDDGKEHSAWIAESVTSEDDGRHVDTGIVIDKTTMPLTRVRIDQSIPQPAPGCWPVNGISGDVNKPCFFFGPNANGIIHYGGGNAGNMSTGVSYAWGHRAVFDLDFQNKTYKVTDLSTEPATTLVDTTVSYGVPNGSDTFWLFGYNGEHQQRKMTIYAADIWQDGELVASMVPAVSNGVACLYDAVRERFLLPTDKSETAVSTLTAGVLVPPDASSSPTVRIVAGEPLLSDVSVTAENGRLVVRGILVSCGADASGCALRLRYGFTSEKLDRVSVLADSQGVGAFELSSADLLPGRCYCLVLETDNGSGEPVLTDLHEVRMPVADCGGSGSRAFEVAGVAMTGGVPTQATLAFAAGVPGVLSCAVAGTPVGEPVEVEGEACEKTMSVPVDPQTGRPYADLEFLFSGGVYGHLVDSVTSLPSSLAAGCLDTGVTVTPQTCNDFRMRVTMSTAQSGVWNVVGHSSSANGTFFVGLNPSGRVSYGFGSQQDTVMVTYNYSDRLTFDLNGIMRTCTVFNETTGEMMKEWTIPASVTKGNMSLLLHGWNEFYREQTIYHAEFWQKGVLVRDLRPCVDKSGVACYYDGVSNSLLYASSDNVLKAGAEIADVFAGKRHLLVPLAADVPCFNGVSVALDETRLGVVTVRGCLSQFGATSADKCALAIVLNDGEEIETQELGVPNADGSFVLDLVGLKSDTTYSWQVKATSSDGGEDVVDGAPFTTLGQTKIAQAVVAAPQQHRVTAAIEFEKFGIGETKLYAFWGGTPDAPAHVLDLGTFTVESDLMQNFSIDLEGASCLEPNVLWFVASNFVGSASATSSRAGVDVTLTDVATYTWKGGASGRWTDPACWICSVADNWGYPNSRDCSVAFPAGDSTVEVDGAFVSSRIDFGPCGANVRLWGSDTNSCRFASSPRGAVSQSDGSTVAVDRVALRIDTALATFALGRDSAVYVTNGACVELNYLEGYKPGSLFQVSDGSVVSSGDYALGEATLVIDDALAICRQFFFVNKERDLHDHARLVFRGRNPRLRMIGGRVATGSSVGLAFANASATREGVVEFEIPPGGYAETPILLDEKQTRYPFGSFEDFRPGSAEWANRTTPMTFRIANRRGTFSELPKFQPLVTWANGIATNFVRFVPPSSAYAAFQYATEEEFPKTLGLRRGNGGLVLLLK